MVMFSGEATHQRFGFTQCRIFGAQSTITFDAADTVEEQARCGSATIDDTLRTLPGGLHIAVKLTSRIAESGGHDGRFALRIECDPRNPVSRGVAGNCGVFLAGRAAGSGGGVKNYLDDTRCGPQKLKYHSCRASRVEDILIAMPTAHFGLRHTG